MHWVLSRTLDSIELNLIKLNKLVNWSDPNIATAVAANQPIRSNELGKINLTPIQFTKGRIELICNHYNHQEEFSYLDPDSLGTLIASLAAPSATQNPTPNLAPDSGETDSRQIYTRQTCRLFLKPADTSAPLQRFLSAEFQVQFPVAELITKFTTLYSEPTLPSPDGAQVFLLEVYNPSTSATAMRITNPNASTLIDVAFVINIPTSVMFTDANPFPGHLILQKNSQVWSAESGNQTTIEVPAGQHIQLAWNLSTPVRCQLPPPPPTGLYFKDLLAAYAVHIQSPVLFERFLNWDEARDPTAPAVAITPDSRLGAAQPFFWFPTALGRERGFGNFVNQFLRGGNTCL